jgi:1,4-alpha-glucan branching enzyme
LPECAYRPAYHWHSPIVNAPAPWLRKGVDQFLAENGLQYFFVDFHMLRGGEPLGTYGTLFPQLATLFAQSRKTFTLPVESRSEYEAYLLPSGVACFARDPETTVRVWSRDIGYPGNEYYLEFHKKVFPSTLRYWRVSQDKEDLGAKAPYDPWQAFENIERHVKDFVSLVKHTLCHYKESSGREGTVVAMYDTELFGHWWWEGAEFLYELAVQLHYDQEVQSTTGSEVLEQSPPRYEITLPEGSWGEGGYHHVWFNKDNHWTWEMLYPAEYRMRELAKNRVNEETRPILEQAARELLLAESSDWQFLISTWAARDYAEARFPDHIRRFERLADLAEKVSNGGSLSEEEKGFITECRNKDSPFGQINLEWWAKLKEPLAKASYSVSRK